MDQGDTTTNTAKAVAVVPVKFSREFLTTLTRFLAKQKNRNE